MPYNVVRLRRGPVRRSRIGALFAPLSSANNVSKDPVPEGLKEPFDRLRIDSATEAQTRCYMLAALPHHGEALKGAELQCAPYTMVFCSSVLFLFLTGD